MEVFGCLADADVFKYFCTEKIFFFLIIIFVTYILHCTNSIENNGPAQEKAASPQALHREGRMWDRVPHMSSAAVHCSVTSLTADRFTVIAFSATKSFEGNKRS